MGVYRNTQGQSGHDSGDLTLWTGLTAELEMGGLQELCVSEITHTLGLLVTHLLWTPSMKVHCSVILKAFRYKKSVLMSRYLQSKWSTCIVVGQHVFAYLFERIINDSPIFKNMKILPMSLIWDFSVLKFWQYSIDFFVFILMMETK